MERRRGGGGGGGFKVWEAYYGYSCGFSDCHPTPKQSDHTGRGVREGGGDICVNY